MLAGLVAGQFAGCASKPAVSADEPARGLELGVLQPSESMLSAELVFSPDPIIARYQRFQGASNRPTSRRSELRVEPTTEGWQAHWWHLPSRSTGSARYEHGLALRYGGDGSVLAASGFGEPGKTQIVFDPPVRLAPALMQSGDRVESEFLAREIDENGKQRGSGPGTSWTEYAGKQRIVTPMGTYDADVVLSGWDFDHGSGQVRMQLRTWIATIKPGRTTIVAQEVEEETTTLGVTGLSRTRLAIESLVR